MLCRDKKIRFFFFPKKEYTIYIHNYIRDNIDNMETRKKAKKDPGTFVYCYVHIIGVSTHLALHVQG